MEEEMLRTPWMMGSVDVWDRRRLLCKTRK
jgi:hypothetical protein